MSVKLLLAEALDTLRKGEEQEAAADNLQMATAKGQTKVRDFLRVKRDYSHAYDTYIRGLEMINYCRRQGIDNKIPELQQFCTQKMTAYMSRCDALREKEANILMSTDQADGSSCLDKSGYAIGDILFQRKEDFKKSNPIRFEAQLTDGSYQVIIKNYDKPGMGNAEMVAQVQLTSANGRQTNLKKMIGPCCAWSRYLGVVSSGTLKLAVSTDAWIRSSRVEVLVRSLLPTQEDSSEVAFAALSAAPTSGGANPASGSSNPMPTGSWVDNLPPLPSMPPVPSGSFPHQHQQHHQQQHQQQPPYPPQYPAPYQPPYQQQPPPGYPYQGPPPNMQQSGMYPPPGYGPAGGYGAGPGYALPTAGAHGGVGIEPVGGYGAPSPSSDMPPPQPQQQQQQHQGAPSAASSSAASAPPPAASASPPPPPPPQAGSASKEAAPLPPPQPAAAAAASETRPVPSPAADAAALQPPRFEKFDVPDEDDAADLGARIAQLRATVERHMPPATAVVGTAAAPSKSEQLLLDTVRGLPEPTPLMDGDIGDFGEMQLDDLEM